MTKRSILSGSAFALASTLAHFASSAQTTSPPVTSLLFLGFPDAKDLDGSVVDAAPTATTYEINCHSGAQRGKCGIYDARITDSPTAYDFFMSVGDEIKVSAHCSKTNGKPHHCVESAGGKLAYKPGVVTTTVASADYKYLPVTLTAGAEKLLRPSTPAASATVTTNTATSSSTSSSSSSSSPSRSSSSPVSIDVPAWAEPTASSTTLSSEVSSATMGPSAVAYSSTKPAVVATPTDLVEPTPSPTVVPGGAAMLCPVHAAGAALGMIFAAMIVM